MSGIATIAGSDAMQTLAARAGTRSEQSFAALMMQQTAAPDAREVLREAAEQLVASVFITPILGAMRDQSTAAGPFAPNTAEKRFGPLLDQQFADRIVQAANFSLVDTIVERYLPAQPDAQRGGQASFERTYA